MKELTMGKRLVGALLWLMLLLPGVAGAATLDVSKTVSGAGTGRSQIPGLVAATANVPGVNLFPSIGTQPPLALTFNGEYTIAVAKDGQWRKVGSLDFDKFVREQRIDLSSFLPADTAARVRLTQHGGGAAHLDAILLGGSPPQEVNGERDVKTLRKLAEKDADLIDAFGKSFELAFPGGKERTLTVAARVEAEVISPTPFLLPAQNYCKDMSREFSSYSYTLKQGNSAKGTDWLKEPFLKKLLNAGSGHPTANLYSYVTNDDTNLYVTMDFTGDNTIDGNKDYNKVFVGTDSGVKEFTVSETETKWGKPRFTYTDKVSYEHKIYDFTIPFKDIGVVDRRKTESLQLAFAAYGTCSPSPNGYKEYPSLAFDSQNNRYLVVYQNNVGTCTPQLFGQLVTNRGTPLAAEFLIGNGNVVNYSIPVVAYDDFNHRFLVVWNNTNGNLSGQLLNTNGSLNGAEITIADSLNFAGGMPSAAFDSINQRFMVVYQHQSDIYGQLVNAAGTLSGGKFPVSTAADSQLEPQLAFDQVNGRFFVVWRDYTGTYDRISGQLVNADGSLFGTSLTISDSSASRYTPDVAFDAGSQRYLVVWRDFRSNAEIYGQLVGEDGTLFGTDSLTNFPIAPLLGNLWSPTVTAGAPGDDFFVTWMDGILATFTGQLVQNSGALSGGTFSVASPGSNSSTLSVAYNLTCGHFMTAFSDFNGTPTDISLALVGNACPAPAIAISPSTPLNFGVIKTGESSPSQVISIANNGVADLSISAISIGADFLLDLTSGSAPCGASLPFTVTPGGFCTAAAAFSPVTAGYQNTTMTISSDDPLQPTSTLTLTGIGSDNPLNLSVTRSGSGSGTVRSSLAGIDCGGTCSADFQQGFIVTLTATPDSESYFNGWSGDACDSNVSLTCLVTMDVAKTVNADFTTTAPVVQTWAEKTTGDYWGTVKSSQQTADGGYVVAGYTDYQGQSSFDGWVAKLDAGGALVWQQKFGGANEDRFVSVQQTADGGYVAAGWTISYGAGSYAAWVVKLDAAGALQWQKTYGDADDDLFLSIQQTADGGYIAVGLTDSNGAGYLPWLLKLNADGSRAWQNTYGNNSALFESVKQTADGGYILVGSSDSNDPAGDAWVVKTDSSGTPQWRNTYGRSVYQESAKAVLQEADGGYVVAGYVASDSSRYLQLFKLNSTGTISWQTAVGGGTSNEARAISRAADGGYIIAGTIDSGVGTAAWLAKVDSTGGQQWQKSYGLGVEESFNAVQLAADGGYFAAGFSASAGGAWLVKTNAGGDVGGCPSGIVGNVTGSTPDIASFLPVEWNILEATSSLGDGTITATPVDPGMTVSVICPDTTPPTDSTDFTATAFDGEVELTWTPATDNVAVTAEKLVFDTAGLPAAQCTNGTVIDMTSGSPLIHASLTNGIPYYYRYCAQDAAGNWSTGATASATPAVVLGHILDANTVALWRLDEVAASSNAVDATGTYHLSQFGNPDAITGKIGNGRKLGGTTKYFQRLGDATLGAALNGDWTYEGWVYLDPSFSAQANLFIYNGLAFSLSQPDTILAEVGILGNRKIYWHQWQTTGSYTEIASNTVLQTGRYYHVAVTRTAQGGNLYTYRIYVNGVLDQTTTGVAGLSYPVSGASHYIGLGNFTSIAGFGIGGNVLNGRLDDTRISKVARTDAEIRESFLRAASTLTVQQIGTGTGTVRSNLTGIDCGGTCSANFATNSIVTLSATPDSESYFNGWSGDACDGNVSVTCLVTMDVAKTVNADFTTTAPTVQSWTKAFGDIDYDYDTSIVRQRPDGSYLVAGMTLGNIALFALDASGSIIADTEQTLDINSGWDSVKDMQLTADGGAVLLDNKNNLLKLSAALAVEWAQNLVDDSEDNFYSIKQTQDGGYIVAGYYNALVMKLSDAGAVQWQYAYNSSQWDKVFAIEQTADGNFVAAGSSEHRAWIFKLNQNTGEVIWQKRDSTAGRSDFFRSIKPTADGGYIAVGSIVTSGPAEALAVKFDENGEIVWQTAFGGSDYDEAASVRQTMDGGYIIAGTYRSLTPTRDAAWLVKLNSAGVKEWDKVFDGFTNDSLTSVEQTGDGGFIASGATMSFGEGGDIWVMKLDQDGNVASCADSALASSGASFSDPALTMAATTVTPTPSGLTPLAATVTPVTPAITTTDACADRSVGVTPGSPVDFGSVAVGSAVPQLFTITNDGNVELRLDAIDLAGATDFSLDRTTGTSPCGDDFPLPLAPGFSCEVTVTFAPLAGGVKSDTLTVATNSVNTPTTVIDLAGAGAAAAFIITASAGTNGGISPSGATSVNSGGSQGYMITPNPGYHVANVLVDGSSVGAVTSYSFSNVTANHTISASFAINTYTVTASAGANGSITPSGATSVNPGGSQGYTLTPNPGYRVANVLVDGASVGAVTSYTFSNVTANHTITANFASHSLTVTASAGTGGGIDPAGASTVTPGGSQGYTITPNPGYRVAEVLVDGSSVGAVTSYTFSNVTANHTIAASFANSLPTATAQSVTTAEDTAVAITLTGSDPEGSALSYAVASTPAHGTVSGTAPNLNYTPAANYYGNDSFTFRVNDGTNNSVPATVSLTVTPVNDPPVATARSVTTAEDTAVAITLTGSDPEGGALTFTIASAPVHGALSGAGATRTYTPAANYHGSDSFTFTADDGTGSSAPATVSLTVTAVNDPPLADAQSVTTTEDTAVTITLTSSDPEGSALTYVIVAAPVHGTLRGTGATRTYTPAANYHGSDSFTFRSRDGTVYSSVATVSLTVTPVNDPPVATARSVTTAEDTAVAIALTGSDPEGSALTFTIASAPVHGALSGTGATRTYTPAANYHGSDSFTFTADDGTGSSAPATVSVTVTAVNDAPTADAQSVTTAEKTAVAITLTGSDPEGSALTYVIVAAPVHGTLRGTGATRTYTPAANYSGSDSFTFRSRDGTVYSSVATVSLTVTPVNDPPVANSQSGTTAEDTAVAITLTGSDPEGSALTFTIASAPVHGALSGAAPNLTYTPAANYHGSDSFTFTADDGTGSSAPATVSLTVRPVNDPPTADAQSVTTAEETAVAITLNGSDPEGSALTYVIIAPPVHGTLRGTVPNLIYTPGANYSGSDSFTFRSRDGTVYSSVATVSLTVTAVNNAPEAQTGTLTVAEDAMAGGMLAATDADSTVLTYSVVSQGSLGTVVITDAASGAYRYAPHAGAGGSDSFTFRVFDGAAYSNTATIAVTITAVCLPPAGLTVPTTSLSFNIALSWLASMTSAVTYQLQMDNGSGFATIYTGTELNYTYAAPGNGNYTFRVRAVRSEDVQSTWVTAGPCKVYLLCMSPSTIYAPTVAARGKVALRWTASATEGVQYELQRSTGSGYVTIYTGRNLYYTATGLAPASYTFRVRAIKTGYAPGFWTTSPAYRTSGRLF